MAFGQDAPDFRAKVQGVRQQLEDYVALIRSIAVPAQGSKT